MICEYASDTDESVLDVHEILKVELKNDTVQSFNTRWDGTVLAMKKQWCEVAAQEIGCSR